MIKTLTGTTIDRLAIDETVIDCLENGQIIYLPELNFNFSPEEQCLLSPDILPKKAKNISYDPRLKMVKAYDNSGPHYRLLKTMMQRYADFAQQLLLTLCPHYEAHLTRARTSYRPVEIAGRRAPSYRKDDSRLHVDAFPASPNQGRQLLRVFSNVHPEAVARVWRVGEPFAQLVERFKPQLRLPLSLSKYVLEAIHITRGLRSDYDALMLQLHDKMKADLAYQQQVPQQRLELNGTWVVYTDQVSHAAMSGQYCLEQTFMLPGEGRKSPESSPLKVLERAFAKRLV